ncbi:MAG: hypothetical protein ACXVZH_05080 [Terriglobales bacterium]
MTLSGGLSELKVQAWPNTFRQSRFLSAVDFVQADRFRRKVAQEMARVFSQGRRCTRSRLLLGLGCLRVIAVRGGGTD